MSELGLSHSHGGTARATWRRAASPWSVVAAGFALVALFDPTGLRGFGEIAAGAFLGTLPYIAFAVLLIAWLKAARAEAVIARAFRGREVRMIVMAAAFGGLAPFCSCEVIPFIAGMLALGAPLSAVMAFWLSSPLIDPPTLLITAAALGWPFAAAKAVAAVGLGLMGGFSIYAMTRAGLFPDPVKAISAPVCSAGPSAFDRRPEWRVWASAERRGAFRTEFLANAAFLIKWLALAYVLEAALISYVPSSIIAGVVGGEGILPIIAAALVGMPAYLNSYVAPPLLAGLTEQGMSMGAAMAFMIAGGVSCIPAMAAVWSLVTARVFAAYIAFGLAGAVLAGVIFQAVI